jgi:hypothetical protein
MTGTDVDRGLSVERSPGAGWRVMHERSGLHCAVTLRLKAEAREFRAELLATGCDFTRPSGRDTGEDGHLHQDPHWADARKVMLAWRPRDIEPRYDPMGGMARMKFCAAYNSDGLIHVTNILMGMTGQHHVHDGPSWDAWRAGIPDEDIIWPSGGPRDPAHDCQCGEPVWQPVAKDSPS